MKEQKPINLEQALEVLKADRLEGAQLDEASASLANRLGLDPALSAKVETIRGCDDILKLFPAYTEGSLSSERRLLVKVHLQECTRCRHAFEGQMGPLHVDWSRPVVERRPISWQRTGWALAACLAIAVCGFSMYQLYWKVPGGARGTVASMNGRVERLAGGHDVRLYPGADLQNGELVRTSGDAHAFVKLSDGSLVEVAGRSEFRLMARGRDTTIDLDQGSVIVQAAHRSSGHLYVKTPDCRVAVTGTIFSVDAGLKGSRVGVIAGAVNVAYAGKQALLHVGDTVTTSDNIAPQPVAAQISWSQDRGKYLPLLAQFAHLQNRLESLPLPATRYSSDLLARMPVNTVFYISIPNLGEVLSEANTIFHEQLQKSEELNAWWQKASHGNDGEFTAMIEKIHLMSRYLGNEVVVAGLDQPGNQNLALLADVTRDGLADYLRQNFASTGTKGGLTVVELSELDSLASGDKDKVYALVRPHEVVLSRNVYVLRQMNAQLNAGASGFSNAGFGQQISSAYSRGLGMILAADLERMLREVKSKGKSADVFFRQTVQGLQYLIAEHRETAGIPENHLNLQFNGERQGVASWLAAPAAIGSLEFVSPSASLSMAFLSKEPEQIFDDLMQIVEKSPEGEKSWTELDSHLQLRMREDIAAHFGGDVALALDGPILPSPAWKMVIEVHDADQLQASLEKLAQALNDEAQRKGEKGFTLQGDQANGHTYYSIQTQRSGASMLHYTFDNGYMIVATDRAVLMQAQQIHDSGQSLARSSNFKSLLPKDQNQNYSAVAYQNLGPALETLSGQLDGQKMAALKELAADARPSVICAWGEANRIEAGSNSRLFGFDLFALASMMKEKK